MVDTGRDFTVFGQIVIMLLIQVGGLGFMSMATLIAFVMKKKRISLRERLILQEALNQGSIEGIVLLIRKVLIYSLTIEGIAAVIFAIRWSFDMPVGRAVYYGIWHAVSLFNNAGFDLFGEYRSLTGYAEDFVVNSVAMALIVLGGIGFVVMAEVVEYKRSRRRLSLHSKVVLASTALLILVGAW